MEQLERPQIYAEKGDGAYWANTALNIEKVRIATELRIKHLARTDRVSPDTEELLKWCRQVEDFVDDRLANFIVNHPTWPWACRILGVGKENYPKVIGLIEKFGRHYDVGDLMIPSYIKREPVAYLKEEKGKVVDKVGIWVAGIERLETPSKLWKYMGLSVDEKTGEVPKRKAGQTLSYNMELRVTMYRLASSLLRAKGVWYYGKTAVGYSLGYEGLRKRIVERKEGIQVVPTPKGRMCLPCNIEVVEKKTFYCPQCNEKLSLKKEPPGFLFQGHLHLMAIREMSKQFSLCLWLIWREALGLPVTQPYSVVKLNHKPIDPWKMVDG